MIRRLNRITPALEVGLVKTYQLTAPVSTHTRPATCLEVDCETQRHGFMIPVDESTELGQRQAHYIRHQAGRQFIEEPDWEPGLTAFTFAAGTACFVEHRVSLDRDPFYIVKGGDWRGNPLRERRVHQRAADWVDDFATHQDKIIKQMEG